MEGRQVKSKKRVADHGEKDKEQVFIKSGEVKELYADSFFHFIVKKICGAF